MTTDHLRELYRRIYVVIRTIPRGAVATYGQVAELAGIPGGARVAAAALKTSKPTDQLPWQRVIGKAGKTRGRIAIHDPVGAGVPGDGVRQRLPSRPAIEESRLSGAEHHCTWRQLPCP